MRELRIHEPAGDSVISGLGIFAHPHPYRRQPFQFIHRPANRLFMSFDQTRIEQRENRNRLRSRTLKIKEPDSAGHCPLRQFFSSHRIDVPLKPAELLRLRIPGPQSEIPRQFPAPMPDHLLMLRIVIVRRKMIHIERTSVPANRLDFRHIEHTATAFV